MVETPPTFEALHKDPAVADTVIDQMIAKLQANGNLAWMYQQLDKESSRNPHDAYPGQGTVITSHEENHDAAYDSLELRELDTELINAAVHGWLYYLALFNHPDRLNNLYEQSQQAFQAPQAKFHPFFFMSRLLKRAVTISDLKLDASGSQQPRVQRSEAHKNLFVSYGKQLSFLERLQNKFFGADYNEGRKQARNITVGAANPEITGSPMALATLAQVHSLVCVPRDGLFATDVKRQADLVTATMEWLERSPVLIDKTEDEKKQLLDFWQHNLVGVIEARADKALPRAQALYDAGIRTFRIYSPEPSSSPLQTLKALRKLEKDKQWEPVEIFVGQVVDVKQAKQLERAGANALYFGIGGGGRCITGVVAGLTINWPELIWQLRGKVRIPMIVEGGANDHMPESMAVGASGIGTAGKFGGTIETPGGYLFICDNKTGRLFKYYGGEASNRMRDLAGRGGPVDFMQNKEGETTRKPLRNGGHVLPIIPQILYEQQQGIVAGLVFQNVRSVAEFQDVAANNLRQASPNDDVMRQTH